MPEVVTVGVYGASLDEFLATLAHERATAVFDIRQRRGVRGTEYAWANAQRLERALEQAGVAYQHHKELAPTTELRRLQYAADDRQGVGKRSRRRLDPEYRRRYTEEILDRVDLGSVVAEMPVRRDDGTPVRGGRSGRLPPVDRRRSARGASGRSRARRGVGPAAAQRESLARRARPDELRTRRGRCMQATTPGDLVTYGDLATELGRPGAGQAVANVLRRAPDLPWWRVVPADGRLYRTHAAVQTSLLEAEGHRVDTERRVDARD